MHNTLTFIFSFSIASLLLLIFIMPSPAHFPDIVTECILRYVTEDKRGSVFDWKQQLQLLAVCHGWRCIGLPMVYQNMYYESRSEDCKVNLEMVMRMADDMIDPSQISSNITLMNKVGTYRYARKLKVRVLQFTHLDWLYITMTLLSNLHFGYWSKIASIEMDLDIDNVYAEPDENDPHAMTTPENREQIAVSFSEFIYLHMRSVKKLVFEGFRQDEVAKPLCNALIKKYAHKLEHLDTTIPTTTLMPKFSGQLSYLRVSPVGDIAQLLVNIKRRPLKYLILDDAPLSFSWANFKSKPDFIHTNFENLQVLEIRYVKLSEAEKPSTDPSSWRYRSQNGIVGKVHFPKLKKIAIENAPPYSDIKFFDIYPKHIDTLSLIYTRFDKDAFENSTITSAQKCTGIFSLPNEDNFDAIYAVTNYMFNQLECTGSNSALHMDFNVSKLDISKFRWNNLHKLVAKNINFSTLTDLLHHLPNLNSMTINDLVPDMSGSDYYTKHVKYPAIKLETILLSTPVFSNHVALFDFFDHVKSLLLSITSLKHLVCKGLESININQLIDIFGKQYPHLAHVKLYNTYNDYYAEV